MNTTFAASEVLGAMITPAVLISASGTLVLSTSNRLTRVVDRVRALAAEAEQMRKEEASVEAEARRRLIASQLPVLSKRALLLRSALEPSMRRSAFSWPPASRSGSRPRFSGPTAGCP